MSLLQIKVRRCKSGGSIAIAELHPNTDNATCIAFAKRSTAARALREVNASLRAIAEAIEEVLTQ